MSATSFRAVAEVAWTDGAGASQSNNVQDQAAGGLPTIAEGRTRLACILWFIGVAVAGQ